MSSASDSESSITHEERRAKRKAREFDELEIDADAPEPPSKKALRKSKKPKTVGKKSSGESNGYAVVEDDVSSDESGEEQPSIPKRSEHGIWIGNLPWSVSREDLESFFEEKGEISKDSILRIHMPGPSQKTLESGRLAAKSKNKGFAYVDFSDQETVTKAIGISETLLSGRAVLIKDAKSYEGRPAPSKAENKDSIGRSTKRVFVGNLTWDLTLEEFTEHFSKCGEVATSFLATFEDTGRCKGYGWVTFKEPESAAKAVRGWVEFEDPKDEEGIHPDDEDNDGEAIPKARFKTLDEGEKAAPAKKEKPRKVRKWWTNRIKGRNLKLEFAEDDSVRYKKRFGKAKPVTNGESGEQNGGEIATNDRSEVASRPRPVHKNTERRRDARNIRPGAALAAAPRLTGGIVASTGKKTAFD